MDIATEVELVRVGNGHGHQQQLTIVRGTDDTKVNNAAELVHRESDDKS